MWLAVMKFLALQSLVLGAKIRHQVPAYLQVKLKAESFVSSDTKIGELGGAKLFDASGNCDARAWRACRSMNLLFGESHERKKHFPATRCCFIELRRPNDPFSKCCFIELRRPNDTFSKRCFIELRSIASGYPSTALPAEDSVPESPREEATRLPSIALPETCPEEFGLLDFGMAVAADQWKTDWKARAAGGDAFYWPPSAYMAASRFSLRCGRVWRSSKKGLSRRNGGEAGLPGPRSSLGRGEGESRQCAPAERRRGRGAQGRMAPLRQPYVPGKKIGKSCLLFLKQVTGSLIACLSGKPGCLAKKI
eukprot:s1692_g2.t1